MAHKFDQVIPWHLLKHWLESQQKVIDHKLRSANDDQIKVLQGRSQQIAEMHNLPQALEGFFEESNEAVLQEERTT